MKFMDGITRRYECSFCKSRKMGKGIAPHVNLRFPLLPICTSQPRSSDILAPYTITICPNCGLIMLLDVATPELLYKTFHSEGTGQVWDKHYTLLADVVAKFQSGSLLEVGAGQGKLVRKLQERKIKDISVVDPQYAGARRGVKVYDSLFDYVFARPRKRAFGTIVSSHTLEHFLEFDEYFECAHMCLEDDGLLITSVPNQEANFVKGYGNQLNYEHPSACQTKHWIALHNRNGFKIESITKYLDHSLIFAARKTSKPMRIRRWDGVRVSKRMLFLHGKSIMKRIAVIKAKATKDKENWIFGASNFTQPLFMYGLDEKIFAGVMDNGPAKWGKRFYGTGLMCRKPEVAMKKKGLRVFLNIGQYNEEVDRQLRKLDKTVETVKL